MNRTHCSSQHFETLTPKMNFKTNALTLLLFLWPAFASLAKETQKKPNILFIFTDDQSHRSGQLLPGSPRLGQDPEHRFAGRQRDPLRPLLHGLLVHGSARHPAHRSPDLRGQVHAHGGRIPRQFLRLRKCPFWPAVSGRTVTRPLKLGNGTPARTMGLGAIGTSKSLEPSRIPGQCRQLLQGTIDPDQRARTGHDPRLLNRQLHQVGRGIHSGRTWKKGGQTLLLVGLLWGRPRTLHPGQTPLRELPGCKGKNPQGHLSSEKRKARILQKQGTMGPRTKWLARTSRPAGFPGVP